MLAFDLHKVAQLRGDCMICIRIERHEDIAQIRKVNEEAFTLAFGQAPEADLVDRLRENCPGRNRDAETTGLAFHRSSWASRILSTLWL
jgi:hypothetical protein